MIFFGSIINSFISPELNYYVSYLLLLFIIGNIVNKLDGFMLKNPIVNIKLGDKMGQLGTDDKYTGNFNV